MNKDELKKFEEEMGISLNWMDLFIGTVLVLAFVLLCGICEKINDILCY